MVNDSILDSVRLFTENRDSLYNLSYDSAHAENMVESDCEAVSFDEVKRLYCNGHGMSEEKSDSVDAIMEEPDGLAFVEFKNGNARTEKQQLRDKGNESMMIFCELAGKTISDTRQTIDYIVVYNEERTKLTQKERIMIARQKQSHLPTCLFDLGKHEGFCFRSIWTMNRGQFKQWLDDIKLQEKEAMQS